MRKTFGLIAIALLLAGCGKEVPVTLDHPVSVDFEQTGPAATLSFAWASCPAGAVSGDELNAAATALDSDVALFLTDTSFEGGAEGWFSAHSADWSFGSDSFGLESGGKYLFAAGEGLELSRIRAGSSDLLVARKGSFAVALGSLKEDDTAALLQQTWRADRETDWIYVLSLPDSSPTLEDATFTDCLYGQFGPVAMAGSRTDYIYTAAGIWSLLRGISRAPLGDGTLYKFTIRAEEGRL